MVEGMVVKPYVLHDRIVLMKIRVAQVIQDHCKYLGKSSSSTLVPNYIRSSLFVFSAFIPLNGISIAFDHIYLGFYDRPPTWCQPSLSQP